MKKYEGILICTDYDGTFSNFGEIAPEDAKAVRYFQENGGLFTIASGRSPDFLWTKRDMFIPNAPVISINGTMINAPDDMRTLAEFPLGDDVVDAACDLWERLPAERISIYGADREGKFLLRSEVGSLRDLFASIPRPWYKILFVQSYKVTPFVLEECKRLYGDRYAFDRSWPEGIELHAKNTGKGECLGYMREYIGMDGLKIVGVGDYENDVSLLRMADIGYAVANATDAVKAAADRVTVSNVEHAIAAIIEELG